MLFRSVGGWIFGINPLTILGVLSGDAPKAQVAQSGPAQRPPADDRMGKFVSTVLADTEDVWKDVFAKGGATYKEPRLVLFRGQTSTGGCGAGQAAMGPFYCPADQKVYIDLAFYETLTKRLGAPGDFAQAYVIAHEVGHHLQYLTGRADQVREAQARASRAQGNRLQVAMELQADCYAGVWAALNKERMDAGDVEEGLRAAHQIGDDVLQRATQGVVVPESFTHGSAEQRMAALKLGLSTGNEDQCEVFFR